MIVRCVAALAALAMGPLAHAGGPDLAELFRRPPMSVRPWVYYWFEGGYGSPAGIARDIAAMREKGIGGVLHMQTMNVTGVPVPEEPRMLSESWARWFSAAAREAGRAGMAMAASCIDGWGMGGWWIGPEHAAKRLTYSETQLDGPSAGGVTLRRPAAHPGWYRDVAVVAFREAPGKPLAPEGTLTSSADQGYCAEENWPGAHAVDGDPETFWRAAQGAITALRPAWLELRYARPITGERALVLAARGAGGLECEVQAWRDGGFVTVGRVRAGAGPATVGFEPVASDRWRLVVTGAGSPDVRLAEFVVLRSGDAPRVRPGIRWWDFKSANRAFWFYPEHRGDALDEEYGGADVCDVRSADVVDLTGRMGPDGQLAWSAPPGRWTVLRFGATLVGQAARMASAPGYEADPLSVGAADALFHAASRMVEVTGGPGRSALRAFHTDSWEIGADVAGLQPNWTNGFRARFQALRGYDLVRRLPAMARRVVDGREATNRFLYDYRATVADLMAGFYGRLQTRAHAVQCLMNPESGYGTYPFPHMDGLQVFGRADLPMAEVWHENDVMSRSSSFCDSLRTAASGARIYGRNVVQAETLTFAPMGGPATEPHRYRATLNRAFVEGLNQAVVHKYVHQPFEQKPGMEDYGIFGRHYSWWPLADGLLGYMGRCQSLLQQGVFVADFLYFVGEGASRFVPARDRLRPPLPAGCDFDGVNAEALMGRLSVRGGRFVLPGGLSYRYLVLPHRDGWEVTPATLERIERLVLAGGTAIGPKPSRSPGLTRRAEWDARVRRCADRLWGAGGPGVRRVGRGRVIVASDLAGVMARDGVAPDCAVGAPVDAPDLGCAAWVWHAPDGDNPPQGIRRFRTTLVIPQGRRVLGAEVAVAADNLYALSVNGRRVVSGADWLQTGRASIASHLVAGRNVVEAAVNNTAAGPAGLVVRAVVRLDGSTVEAVTGDVWESSADGVAWVPARVLGPYGMAPWGRGRAPEGIRALHRRTAAGEELYFVANLDASPVRTTARFRAIGAPEMWDPLSGERRALPEYRRRGDMTEAPLAFEGNEAYFVVFRRRAVPASAGRNFPTLTAGAPVGGPWEVRFDPAWGGPASVRFDRLADWTVRPEEGIRHYSGIATYRTRFDAPAGGDRLGLGTVHALARVRVNGRDLGVAWCAPWSVPIPRGLLRARGNLLEIEVANLWNNRLVGDAGLPAGQRRTGGTYARGAGDPLEPSGLLGPVRLLRAAGR